MLTDIVIKLLTWAFAAVIGVVATVAVTAVVYGAVILAFVISSWIVFLLLFGALPSAVVW